MEITNLNISTQLTDRTNIKEATSASASTKKDFQASISKTSKEDAISDPEILFAIEKISDFVSSASNNKLAITIDRDLEKIVMTVKNIDSDEVIRQIPSEEALNLLKRMQELSEEYFGDAAGLFFEKKI